MGEHCLEWHQHYLWLRQFRLKHIVVQNTQTQAPLYLKPESISCCCEHSVYMYKCQQYVSVLVGKKQEGSHTISVWTAQARGNEYTGETCFEYMIMKLISVCQLFKNENKRLVWQWLLYELLHLGCVSYRRILEIHQMKRTVSHKKKFRSLWKETSSSTKNASSTERPWKRNFSSTVMTCTINFDPIPDLTKCTFNLSLKKTVVLNVAVTLKKSKPIHCLVHSFLIFFLILFVSLVTLHEHEECV